ncbi:prenyltransferase, UbiA family [Bacteriovorax sp. BAL6_X]|uniref:prenyltransferase, UbiA family n=1 Tax=Bacteriovorax sp. BAL6_X TaxID=1201290 RepID=UPI000385EE7F|nr:prenyltransferase, UbiA family [Bacteriovorax sp. BAL6_X]EPZ50042.1 prenyltransferase, UbiA family [Bacteriovorax sp. BAL6_X]
MSKDISHITMEDSFIKRYLAWSNERFPMANVISGLITFFVMSRLALFLQDKALDFTPLDFLGAIAVVGHYFVLRVFDEHKDFKVDCINHPERALQRGLIKLWHLDIIAAIFTVIGLSYSFLISNNYLSLICYGAVYLWSVLMAKEFFIGTWLEKRLTLYSISHMLVSPLIIIWIMSAKWQVPTFEFYVYLILAMAFASGFSYEFTRKTRGPEEETETLDSYTKIYGAGGSVLIITLMNMITLGCFLYLIPLMPNLRSILAAMGIAGFAAAQSTLFKYLKKPSLDGRKKNEKSFGLFALLLYIALIVGVYAN